MVRIPAFCDFCNKPFPSSFVFENCQNVTFSGNKAGPCPACGGIGSIPDGTFHIMEDVIEVISAPSATIDQLETLKRIFSEARKSDATSEQISTRLEKELPELAKLKDWLPKTRLEL